MIATLFPPQKLGDHKELAEWLDRVYLRPFALEDSQMAPFGAFQVDGPLVTWYVAWIWGRTRVDFTGSGLFKSCQAPVQFK